MRLTRVVTLLAPLFLSLPSCRRTPLRRLHAGVGVPHSDEREIDPSSGLRRHGNQSRVGKTTLYRHKEVVGGGVKLVRITSERAQL